MGLSACSIGLLSRPTRAGWTQFTLHQPTRGRLAGERGVDCRQPVRPVS